MSSWPHEIEQLEDEDGYTTVGTLEGVVHETDRAVLLMDGPDREQWYPRWVLRADSNGRVYAKMSWLEKEGLL